MGSTPMKKVIKAKIRGNKELTEVEKLREKVKYEIAGELGLLEKVQEVGWAGLTAKETGRIGGIMNSRRKNKNKELW